LLALEEGILAEQLPENNKEVFPSAIDEEQLQIYAKELHDLYQAEKKQREKLAEEKLVLDYRIRELSAINALFQKNRERYLELERQYIELIEQLKKILAEAPLEEYPKLLQKLLSEAEAKLPPKKTSYQP